MQAVVIGSTGLIGRELIELLIEDSRFSKIHAVTRRDLQTHHTKVAPVVTDLNHLGQMSIEIPANSHFFCCLGTTMKKAGSQKAFMSVDLDAVVEFGKWAQKQQAQSFSVVSALGADPNSSVFYNRVKGLMEARLQELNLKRLVIARPSLLLGPREESRPAEEIFKVTARWPIWKGPLRRYRPIEGKTVAQALLRGALSSDAKLLILENEQLDGVATGQ